MTRGKSPPGGGTSASWLSRWLAGRPESIEVRHFPEIFDVSEALIGLDDEARARLSSLASSFLSNKRFETAGGLDLTDHQCVRIALEASLPVLELGLDWYRRASSVLLYPAGFRVEQNWTDEDGIVHDREAELIGEAWDGGPVILAWEDVESPPAGSNVVIHEFAHVLDALNGRTNGFPPVGGPVTSKAWSLAFSAAFADHCRRVERDGEVFIDDYGAENEAEFFAVMTETFFTWPENVAEGYPAVYDVMCRFFHQDPLRRQGSARQSARSPPHR